MGENRWAFKTEMGFVKGLSDKLYFDLTGYVKFYTNNDDYTPQSLTLKKRPVYLLESHLSYDLSKTLFLAVDYFSWYGGKEKVTGGDWSGSMNNHAAGLTLGYAISPSGQLLIKYYDQFKTRTGVNTKTLGLRFAYFF